MTEFIALRPERVDQIITAWAAARWPLKERHAARVLSQTGFMPDRHGTHAFRSELCPVADSFFISNGKHVQSAHIALSTIATPDQYGHSAPLAQSAYAQIIDARTGAKREVEDDGTGLQSRWRLANGSNIVLGANQALVDLTVNSPEQTEILDWQILWELQGRPE